VYLSQTLKAWAYIKYFFFLTKNWDAGIAWHVLRKESKGEKKYRINTTGADELEALEDIGIDTTHANIYMPISYDLLEVIFEQLQLLPNKPTQHFLDIGCGKGRALCVAAHYRFTEVTGVDFSKKLIDAAEKNLALTKKNIPALDYELYNNDAFYFEIPADTDCIFLFNPFDEVIMSGVVYNILESLKESNRTITVIYVNPMHKEAFTIAGFTEVYYKKSMRYLEVSILQNAE
jgi:SAM-dependent methyltransferase